MKLTTLLSVLIVNTFLVCQSTDSRAAWTITDPEEDEMIGLNANIPCMGDCDQDSGTAFIVKLIQNNVTKQAVSGTANTNEGQIEDWSATLNAPSGGWDSGAATVKLKYDLSGSQGPFYEEQEVEIEEEEI